MARVKAMLAQDPLRRWNRLEAMETYGIARWGCGYFDISDTGNLIVTPRGPGNGTMDMRELIDELTGRGIQLPILLRFSDILRARIELICGAFNGAMKEYDYKGQYRGVYPIKVNQNRTVVEEIIEYGRPFHYGLEAGSKPELLTVMAIHQDDEALLLCNGYKDENYIETALLSSKLGIYP
jgi:arginine decarboxylase